MAEKWWLYMIECEGGGIYVGVAKNVKNRYSRHSKGTGALYTKYFPPKRLLCMQEFPNQWHALQAEKTMKRRNPLEKMQWAYALSGGTFTVDLDAFPSTQQ